MTLSTGTKLAHYEIISQIGAGGMGEVYQAKDTKLGRDVAIKVLPQEFAQDTERVARFEREAKLLASLNHPNIAAIYGLEESDGTNFLVMELVEGDTLDARIKKGSIPVEEALKLALQIAEALEAAHEKGVIHRDLKPANIKVTPDGKVKVLDFGLAKAFAGEQDQIDLSHSPTLSDMATQQGVILGTAAYMPPEQAKGKPVDKRADVWAFGVVLFEMLTGRSLFTGETGSEILAAVIKSEPEWSSLPQNLHPRIRLMLERCLEKDPKKRYSGINDAWVDIEKVLSDPGGVYVHPVAEALPKMKSRQMLLWASITVILIIIAGVVVWNLRAPESPQIMSFSDLPPDDFNSDSNFTISQDGKKFVYSTTKGFYIRSVDETEAQLIYETNENPQWLFFSPDGQWIGYWSTKETKLKKIAVKGGAPVDLCNALSVSGARWYEDDTIVFSDVSGVMRVSASGGTPVPILKPDYTKLAVEGLPVSPQILPDGKTLLYTRADSWDPLKGKIMLYSLETEKSEELFDGFFAGYLPTGHIVYALGNLGDLDVIAVPFDLDSLKVIGTSITMLERIIDFTISESGTVAYISRTAITSEPGRTLVWVDREGHEEPLDAPPYKYISSSISHDGKRIALLTSNPPDILIHDIDRKITSNLTLDKSREWQPVWTLNDKRIIYYSDYEGLGGIYWRAYDGAGKVEKLSPSVGMATVPWSITPDGKFLLLSAVITWQNVDIGMLSLEGGHEAKPLLQNEYIETYPTISPEGQWMAYFSKESDTNEVYIRSFPDVEARKVPVSSGGGACPLWSPDGKELFYIGGGSVMAVTVQTEPTLDLGEPKKLFPYKYLPLSTETVMVWDIHPDGDKFLMIKPSERTDDESATTLSPKINVIVNWVEELKDRLPVD